MLRYLQKDIKLISSKGGNTANLQWREREKGGARRCLICDASYTDHEESIEMISGMTQ